MTYETLRPAKGAALRPGWAYHDIPGVDGPSHRHGSAARVAQIAATVTLTGRRVLDLGCSVGGVAIAAAQRGADVVGLDHDAEAVAVGNIVADRYDLPVDLRVADLADLDTWQILGEQWDVVLWLSNWMWIADAAGYEFACRRLQDVAATGATLVFETAEASGSMAGNHGVNGPADVRRLLTGNGFTTIAELGPSIDRWHSRTVFAARRDDNGLRNDRSTAETVSGT